MAENQKNRRRGSARSGLTGIECNVCRVPINGAEAMDKHKKQNHATTKSTAHKNFFPNKPLNRGKKGIIREEAGGGAGNRAPAATATYGKNKHKSNPGKGKATDVKSKVKGKETDVKGKAKERAVDVGGAVAADTAKGVTGNL